MAIFDAGSLAYQGTTVTNSATQVYSASGLTSPQNLVVLNQGTAIVYVGGGTVTTTSGVPLTPGNQLVVGGSASLSVWAITASGTATVVAGLATVDAVV